MTNENPKNLRLDEIRIDGGTQPRVAINNAIVAEYADLYGSGTDLPPVVVFFDGVDYWLADGFHRYWANKRIDCETVFARVYQGTQRDAVLYSVGANAQHGLRRTNADKRKAVLTLLDDPEWSTWSDYEIARRCGVTHTTVRRHRDSLEKCSSEKPSPDPPRRKFKSKHGTVGTMQTARIGRSCRKGTKKRRSGKPAVRANIPIKKAETFQARLNIDIPHNANAAARVIRSRLGDEFARRLIDELTVMLERS